VALKVEEALTAYVADLFELDRSQRRATSPKRAKIVRISRAHMHVDELVPAREVRLHVLIHRSKTVSLAISKA
jgi:hypothetical protein